ncbi:proline--tRNA ligase [Candidatus Zinderia endosymbiont of Aphrophora alni]|uniref:proline--tRNA ligase n=1 Tax=Candidatus Zinderia endosymbiont of Aphrophora alni TaxID=3077951 RepID=UPI0030CD0BF2
MRAKNFFISTIKNKIINKKNISYKLMIKSGIIKKLSSGIYIYMPIGLRIIKKIKKIIRKEMQKSGAHELLMPIVQPINLWQKSGRLEKLKSEIIKFKDRNNKNYILQPTSEEVITYIVKKEIQSYKQLPINFFHIQTKFRDEIRPKFGLIRSREFLMKDAYSFDKNKKGLLKSYNNMYNTYIRIFNKINLKFKIVSADNGNMGGEISHEFHAISNIGETFLTYCKNSNFLSKLEFTKILYKNKIRKIPKKKIKKISILDKNNKKKIINKFKKKFLKCIPIIIKKNIKKKNMWLIIIKSNHELNKKKIHKIFKLQNFRIANKKEIFDWFGVSKKFIGPIKTKKPIKILINKDIYSMRDFICGANEENMFFTGVNWERDIKDKLFIKDIRNAINGDLSPDKQGILKICRGIEIGHIFQIGKFYSKLINSMYINKLGKKKFFHMGCYGIGITRILSVIIEQNFDEKGIIWPNLISPFNLVICPINFHNNKQIKFYTKKIYKKLLLLNIDVILDDRNIKIGSILSDWELIGIPHFIIIGNNYIKYNKIDYKNRLNLKKINLIKKEKIINFLKKKII